MKKLSPAALAVEDAIKDWMWASLMNFMFRHRRELDEFESETKALATSGVCEGSCEKHTGATKALRTVGRDGTDWGWFSYCETAQEENRVMGFSLYEKTPCSSQLNQAQ